MYNNNIFVYVLARPNFAAKLNSNILVQLGVTRSQAMASVSKSTLGHGLSVKVDFWPWPQIHFDTVAMARTPL